MDGQQNEAAPLGAATAAKVDVAAALRRRSEVHELPGRGVRVVVWEVSAGDMLKMSALPPGKQIFGLMAACLEDEAGDRLFGSADEVEALGWVVVSPLMDRVKALNPFAQPDAAGAEKNSKSSPSSP